MGKNSYRGGSTTFVDGDPRWGTNGRHKMGGIEEQRLREARGKLEKVQRRGANGETGPRFRKELKAATQAVDAAEKALKAARQPPKVTRNTEQDIADVRKQVTALANRVRSAIGNYEEERARLEKMLRANGFDLTKYPEAKRLDFSDQS